MVFHSSPNFPVFPNTLTAEKLKLRVTAQMLALDFGALGISASPPPPFSTHRWPLCAASGASALRGSSPDIVHVSFLYRLVW